MAVDAISSNYVTLVDQETGKTYQVPADSLAAQSVFGDSSANAGVTDTINGSDVVSTDYACTDGKNDGKISTEEKVTSAFKGIVKMVASPITEAMKGNFGPAIMTAVGIGVVGILGTPALIAMGVAGTVTGACMFAGGIQKVNEVEQNGGTDAEAKQACEQIGQGAFTFITSAASTVAGVKTLRGTQDSYMNAAKGKGFKEGFKAYFKDLGKSFGKVKTKIFGAKTADTPDTPIDIDDGNGTTTTGTGTGESGTNGTNGTNGTGSGEGGAGGAGAGEGGAGSTGSNGTNAGNGTNGTNGNNGQNTIKLVEEPDGQMAMDFGDATTQQTTAAGKTGTTVESKPADYTGDIDGQLSFDFDNQQTAAKPAKTTDLPDDIASLNKMKADLEAQQAELWRQGSSGDVNYTDEYAALGEQLKAVEAKIGQAQSKTTTQNISDTTETFYEDMFARQNEVFDTTQVTGSDDYLASSAWDDYNAAYMNGGSDVPAAAQQSAITQQTASAELTTLRSQRNALISKYNELGQTYNSSKNPLKAFTQKSAVLAQRAELKQQIDALASQITSLGAARA